jgi:glycerophosphoryl diester phosphodiesterase
MTEPARIIAHRGYAERYPENTVPAFQAALDAGADAVELDVQFSQDGTPVVLHDPTLDRLAGRSGEVASMTLEELRAISVHEPERFGDRFEGTKIPTLAEVVEALRRTPQALAFIDIKRDTLARHAIPQAVETVLDICEPLGERAVILSFDGTVVQEARSLGKRRVGWALSEWNTGARDRLETIQPDFAFVDNRLLPPPPTPLWEGPWEWVVYEINDAQRAAELARRGFRWIETQAVEALVAKH